MESETLIEDGFRLFSSSSSSSKPSKSTTPTTATTTTTSAVTKTLTLPTPPNPTTFADLGLAPWAVSTCAALGMKRPTPVQCSCIPRIIAGEDVLGLAETGSGKTAAFALPILQRLALDPFGVFALVITPTRELAYQLADQFRALGSCLNLRCVVGRRGMDSVGQARALAARPHVVVSTPGRLKVLVEGNSDLPAVFAKTKFLVLDEADRVLDVGFEEELRVIFRCLPEDRQTLLFSATMTDNLQALLEVSVNKSYFYQAYEGFKTVESLKQQYVFVPKRVKYVYLLHILSKMEEKGMRSAIVFVSTCRSCHLLSLLLEELDQSAVALHSYKSQALRLSALNRFKSGQVPVLLATDVASRGLDIPTVDLVLNYDIPRYPRDYVHRVGRTARAGRGGLSVSLVTQNDVDLVHKIEDVIGKQLDTYECKENEVLDEFTKVCKAKRVAKMKMIDDGFDEKVKARKAQKQKSLAEKGLLKK
ncbi:DEAD-box ATP-dependent RNA helicase 36 [Acorus calamus]|uniref:DEAD-box ATP-dependent RNA helicase 36 n=1 Tax=Acorus calamus TaxID=4465 RepID=A0AAV9DQI2_ACOCL|nr:DEAD-box ATP-dependent RNA helicase 36 [Acorus calamus]